MSNDDTASAGKGFLRRDGDSDGIIGHLTDAFGMVTEIRGVPDVQDGVKGYAISARLVSVPTSLKVPGIDDDR